MVIITMWLSSMWQQTQLCWAEWKTLSSVLSTSHSSVSVDQSNKKTRKIELLSHLDHVVFLLWGMSKNVYLICALINGFFFQVTVLFQFVVFQQLKLQFFLHCVCPVVTHSQYFDGDSSNILIKVLPPISPWCYFVLFLSWATNPT